MKAKAYPTVDVKFIEAHRHEFKYADSGMDLRDYYAAHATEADVRHWQIRMADQMNMEARKKGTYTFDNRTQAKYIPRELAKYRYADQMIKAKVNQV